MVCPRLLEHTKEDIGRNSDLMKSILEAREFRQQMPKNKRRGLSEPPAL